MTPEDNQEIAEWCGWTDIHDDSWGAARGQPPGGECGWKFSKRLPKYDSPNACAEFEETADCNRLLTSYLHALHEVRFPGPMYRDLHQTPDIYAQALWMATPAQRCKAILVVIREPQP